MFNVLYLHTHDTGRMLSPYGYRTPTPNYESLFSDSVVFQHAYAAAPTCSPSRAALLTGCHPHQVGMLGLAQRGFEFDASKHLARFLNDQGFETMLCGVQHEVGYYLDHHLASGALGYSLDLTADHHQYSEADLVYWDSANADNLCRWLLSRNESTPFFASYGMHATHRRFPTALADGVDEDTSVPPPTMVNNAETRRDFAGFLTSAKLADDNLGRVISALRAANQYDNTIIIVTTDHGVPFPFAKGTLNDSGIGVALAMRVPNSQAHGTFDGLVSHVDVFPTLCDLLDLPMPEHVVGQSFATLFSEGEHPGDEAVFAHTNFHTSYEPARAVRTRRWKYIRYFDDTYSRVNISNIDNSPTKSFYLANDLTERTKDAEQLYDTFYDPAERNNLVHRPECTRILEEMRRLLQEQMEATDDPLLEGLIHIKPTWRVNRPECVEAGSKSPNDYVSWGESPRAKPAL